MKETKKDRKVNRKFALGVFLVLTSIMFLALASAVPVGNVAADNGYFIDDNVKVSSSSRYTVGYGNDSSNVASTNDALPAMYQTTSSMNTSAQAAKVTLREGRLIINNTGSGQSSAITWFLSDVAERTGGNIWIQGQGASTQLVHATSGSRMFTLGNPTSTTLIMNNVKVSDISTVGNRPLNATANSTGGLFNGNPSAAAGSHQGFTLRDIQGYNVTTRYVNVHASNIRMDSIDINIVSGSGAGCYGGEGSKNRFTNINCIGGNYQGANSEVEGLDINGADDLTGPHQHVWVSNNYVENFKEQAMDVGAMFQHGDHNTWYVNSPTDQGGVTVAADWSIWTGNIGLNSSNSRGAIEQHTGNDFGIYANNIIVTNDTNPFNLTEGSNFSNPNARCMRLDGRNGTIMGNIFKGCQAPFQGATGNENQLIGNWFEPTVNLSEGFRGINYINGYWKIQGADVLATRNVTANDTLIVNSNKKICLDGSACTIWIRNNGSCVTSSNGGGACV